MCTYLKNMVGWKPKDLKNKSFANIQELFDKAMKRVNTFVDMDIELVEGNEVRTKGSETREESSSKRAGEALEQESSKKQKLEEDKESEELKQCLEVIPDDGDDVTIDATPLSTKSPSISIVKARFKKTEPVNYMDNFLLLNLKTMFEHHVEDNNILYYLLVEKMYPLTNHTLHQMFNDVKLQVDYECEMAFELIRLGRVVGIKRLLDDLKVTAAQQGIFDRIKKNNAYHGMFDEDVVDHIAKVLELLDLIKIPGVDSHRLRMKVFHLSLADDARQWWINEKEGKITTWEELVEKFFCKFYLESHNGEDEMLDEGDNWRIDPLEFISRVNSSFENHMKVDGRTKSSTKYECAGDVVDFKTWLGISIQDHNNEYYGFRLVIMEYVVKISKKARILELKRDKRPLPDFEEYA
ncbi:hypothetical protein Tco_1007662, partial [Tanacetum coccineum]